MKSINCVFENFFSRQLPNRVDERFAKEHHLIQETRNSCYGWKFFGALLAFMYNESSTEASEVDIVEINCC